MKSILLLLSCFISFFIPIDAQQLCDFSKLNQALSHLHSADGYHIIENLTEFSRGNCIKLKLENGLDAYIISDPAVTQSAAALSVEAGSWDNPKEHPGMAHFVEHLLFLGTKKFPHEADFSNYIGERGGEYNAFTAHDRTVYGFSINHEGLEGGLERLAHFFIDPLFSSSAIEREMHAVHHEFEDNIENDASRIWRILKETGNPRHPNAVFSCGNLESLSGISRKNIKSWFKKYYGSNKMHLTIISSLPTQVLVQWTQKYFSSLKPCEERDTSIKEHLTTEHQKGHMIHASPSYKKRSLELVWEVPKELVVGDGEYLLDLICFSLDHDGVNSLSDLLCKKGLALSAAIDYWRIEKESALFLVEVDLTPEGARNVELVTSLCHSAINTLKRQGVPIYLHEQLFRMEHEMRHYFSPLDPFSFAMETSLNLIDNELSSYPSMQNIPTKLDFSKIDQILTSFSPSECVYFLIAPEDEVSIKKNALERWMKTPYAIRRISDEKLAEWSTSVETDEIALRSQDHESKEEITNPWDSRELKEESIPVIIRDGVRVHLLTEEGSEEDSTRAFFSLSSHMARASLKNATLNMIFVTYLHSYLAATIPSSDDFSWELIPSDSEIFFFFQIKEKASRKKLNDFAVALKNMPKSFDFFELVKKFHADNYSGDPDPIEYASNSLRSILNPGFFTRASMQEALGNITFDDFCYFSSLYFYKLQCESLFCGDLTPIEVEECWRTIETVLCPQCGLDEPREMSERKSWQSLWDEPLVQKKTTHRKGNGLALVLNLGTGTKKIWAVQKIISQILQEEFFYELRTKQQTSYRLFSWADTFQDKLLHHFTIQSSTHTPEDLLSRTEIFLDHFCLNFQEIVSKERILLVKHMLISSLKQQLLNMHDKESKRSILSSIEALKDISYECLSFELENLFSSKNSRRLAVLIEGGRSLEAEKL